MRRTSSRGSIGFTRMARATRIGAGPADIGSRTSGHGDNGHALRFLMPRQLAGQLEAGAVGQSQVEQNQRRPLGGCTGKGFAQTARFRDMITGGFEQSAEGAAQERLIVDKQDR